jgi:hypothetical protein
MHAAGGGGGLSRTVVISISFRPEEGGQNLKYRRVSRKAIDMSSYIQKGKGKGKGKQQTVLESADRIRRASSHRCCRLMMVGLIHIGSVCDNTLGHKRFSHSAIKSIPNLQMVTHRRL